MLIPEVTGQIKAIADSMVGPVGCALDALPEVAKALNDAEERIKVEMLARIAHSANPSDDVVAFLKLDGEAT